MLVVDMSFDPDRAVSPAHPEKEAAVEQYLAKATVKLGGQALKWVSPGNAGVPDRIILLPVPPEHIELVSRYVKFAELKSPTGKLRPIQARMIRFLQSLGYVVAVPRTKDEVDQWLAS